MLEEMRVGDRQAWKGLRFGVMTRVTLAMMGDLAGFLISGDGLAEGGSG